MAFERKLYPPIIESKLKAFSSNGEKGLVIQYRQNPSVSNAEIIGFACQIKTLGGSSIGVLKTFTLPTTMKGNQGEVRFNWSNLQVTSANMKGLPQDTLIGEMDPKGVVLIADEEKNESSKIIWPTRIYHDDQLSGDWMVLPGEFSQISSQYQLTLPPALTDEYTTLSTGAVGYLEDTAKTDNSTRTLRELSINPDNSINDITNLINNSQIIKKLSPNNFYKVQLAYISKLKDSNNDNRIGYYSDVAIIKYVNEPHVYLEGFDTEDINIMSYRFTGVVTDLEETERLYSYRYIIETIEHDIEYDSGELIYDSSEDAIQVDEYGTHITSKTHLTYLKDLPRSRRYFITYYITTTSGLQAQSASYMLKTGYAIGLKFKNANVRLQAESLIDSGCVRLSLKTTDDNTKYVGKFRILRTDEYSNFKQWTEIFTFELNAERINATDGQPRFLFNDGTIEQATTYQYALQQYNDWGIVSNKLLSKRISVDYEDLYLSDADQVLRICFNPNVSTFKPTILESKLETIGSKYPYIFRNGIVNYKEFALTGLISYLMDQDHVFLPEEETIYKYVEKDPRLDTQSKPEADIPNEFITNKESISLVLTDLTGLNIQYERNFKLKVLDWLTNGRPKLMRSPTEGNYIVRLTGVALSPQAQLGRMLHTFNCTAYEIDELTMENLRKYNLIKTKRTSPRDEYPEIEETYTFPTQTTETNGIYGIISGLGCTMPTEGELYGAMENVDGRLNGYTNHLPQYLHKVRLRDFIPGSCIGLEFLSQETGELYKVPIIIGLGGSYNVVPTDFVMGIYPIWCPPQRVYEEPNEINPAGRYIYSEQPFAGTITYCYEDYFVDRTFDLIKSVVLSDEIVQGSGMPINEDLIDTIYYFRRSSSTMNFFEFYQLQNLKRNIAAIHALHINRREILDCYLIPERDLLPHYYDASTQTIEREKRDQLFFCRTAIVNIEPSNAIDENIKFSPDGKIPLLAYEILDNTIYRCHYWNGTNEEIYYLDGWLLKLTLEDYHRQIASWNSTTLYSNGNDNEKPLTHLSVFEYVFVPQNTWREWLKPCMINADQFESNSSEIELVSLNDGESLNYFVLDGNESIRTYCSALDNSYHIKQIIERFAEANEANRQGGEVRITEYDTPLAFDCVIPPTIMIDAAITVADLEYDLSASGHSNEWQQLLRWFNSMITSAQTNFQNSTSEFARVYWDYHMRHYMEIYLTALNWFLIEASIINQPLMIPPFPGLDVLIGENYYQEATHDATSIDDTSEDVDDTVTILGNTTYTKMLYKPLSVSSISYDSLQPGVYCTGDAECTITNAPGGNITLAANSMFMKPYASKIAFEMTQVQAEAISKAYGSAGTELAADLAEERKVTADTTDVAGCYRITDDIENITLTNELQKVLKENNCVHLHPNAVLCILNAKPATGKLARIDR